MKCFQVILFGLVCVCVAGCGVNKVTMPKPDAGSIQDFAERYAQWEEDREGMKHMSFHTSFTNLPGFRAIVDLGSPALPHIRDKLQEEPNDIFLTYAIMEINGWPEKEFESPTYEEIRDKVLRRLK